MRIKNLFLAFGISAASSLALGQETPTLPPVYVPGTIAPAPANYTWTPGILFGTPVYGSPEWSMHQIIMIGQMNRASQALSDVRCIASSGLRETTSHSDLTTRWLAASEVYTRINSAAYVIKNATIGTVRSPVDGITYKAYTITYADGGTERWMIFPDPRSSNKIIDQPLPDSLVKGDGRPKPTAICGGGIG